ncbi:DUF805 domain-containing protein [Renibacterium salmoninarum]|nr:DUF805 domain-containing protein [Renibacterium salmoninarum]
MPSSAGGQLVPSFGGSSSFIALGAGILSSLSIASGDGTLFRGSALETVWSLATLLPTLGVLVRRLRDTGRTWPHVFWLLVPIGGLVVLAIFLSEPGTPAEPSQTGESGQSAGAA